MKCVTRLSSFGLVCVFAGPAEFCGCKLFEGVDIKEQKV